MKKIKFRNIQQSDLSEIVTIHRKSFDKLHFSVCFDDKLLFDYFSTLIKFNPSSFLAEDENGGILGYIISGDSIQYALNNFTNRNKLPLLLLLFRNRNFLFEKAGELFQKIFLARRKKQPNMRIFIIAVSAEYKAQGIGSLLLEEFENRMRRESVREYGLSVRKGNENALKFYQKKNFKLEFISKKSYYFSKSIQ